MVKKSLVYSNPDHTNKYSRGYLGWYDNHYESMARDMFSSNYGFDFVEKFVIHLKEKKTKYHFANRIKKTHPYSIPALTLVMKMKHFLKEEIDKFVIEQTGMVQMEFDFMKEKSK